MSLALEVSLTLEVSLVLVPDLSLSVPMMAMQHAKGSATSMTSAVPGGATTFTTTVVLLVSTF